MTATYGFGFDFARPRSRCARIARIDALATLLDTAFVLPGTSVRFGFDALIGLFPAVGDLITTALSLFIVHEAYQLGAPSHVIARMLVTLRSTASSARCRWSVMPLTFCGARTGATCDCCASGWRARGAGSRAAWQIATERVPMRASASPSSPDA